MVLNLLQFAILADGRGHVEQDGAAWKCRVRLIPGDNHLTGLSGWLTRTIQFLTDVRGAQAARCDACSGVNTASSAPMNPCGKC